MNNNFIKSFLLHIKYPYTAAIISVMWIGIAIIIGLQQNPEVEILVAAVAIASLIIAVIGFSSRK